MQYRSIGIVMAMLIFFSVPVAPVYAADVGPCRAGEHPATADDVKVMKAAGITGAVVGMCWNSKDKIVGQDAGQAKQELEQMWCGGKPATCGSYTSTISGLDTKFATCAAKFMKELRQVDPRACIRSAYRSTAHQVCACGGNANGIRGKCAPAGRSYHQKGLAIDVNHRNNNAQFWQIAAKSGLYNPAGLHVSDPDHIQAKGGISDCSSGALPPDDQGDYFQDTQRFFPAPANPFANPNTPFMAPPPPPPPPPQQQQCQPRYQCSGNTLMYIDSSCQQQPYQQCPGGCNGDVCVANPPQQQQPQQTSQPQQQPSSGQTGSQPTGGTSSSGNTTGANNPGTQTLPSPNPVSDLLSSPLLSGYTELPRIPTSTPLKVPKATTTPFDLIQRYAQETSTTTDATEEEEDYYIQPDVSEILNADLTDVTHIRPNTRPLEEVLNDAPPSRPNTATGTLAIQQPVGQTFVTNDLKDSPVPAATTSNVSSNSTIGRILTNLRTILEWALRFLRSFNQSPVAPLPTATFQPVLQYGS